MKDPSTNEIWYRMVDDFRNIHYQLEYWSFPLMRIDRIFSKLFSTLDVRSCYYNITVAEHSRKYTAFPTEYGKYKFPRVQFVIHVVPSYLALRLDENLTGQEFWFTYPGDIIILFKS